MRNLLTLVALVLLSLPAAADDTRVQGLALDPRIEGGNTVRGTLFLDRVSPEGTWVELWAHGPLNPPSVVRVPAGADRAEFTLLTDPVPSTTLSRLYASVDGNRRSVDLVVTPAASAAR